MKSVSAGGLTSRRALCPTCLKCAPRVVSNVRSRLVFCIFALWQPFGKSRVEKEQERPN